MPKVNLHLKQVCIYLINLNNPTVRRLYIAELNAAKSVVQLRGNRAHFRFAMEDVQLAFVLNTANWCDNSRSSASARFFKFIEIVDQGVPLCCF